MAPCRRHGAPPRRRRQVRLVRRVPADAPRPRGRAARRRRSTSTSSSSPRRRSPSLARSVRRPLRGGVRQRRRRTSSGSSSCGAQTQLLVTIGACATAGGIQALRNWGDHDAFRAGGLRPPRVRRLAGPLHARSPSTSRWTPSCAAARSIPSQLVELLTALTTGRRPQLPRRGRLHGVQAARRRLRDGQQGDPVPRPGHPDRLRRDLPALRPRLLRLLRPARAGQRGRPRPATSRWPATGRARRSGGCSPASPPTPSRSAAWSPSSAARGPGAAPRRRQPTPAHAREARHEHAPTTQPRPSSARLRGRRAHPRRGRGLAPPAASATARSIEARLGIFEAPRYFEQLVVGRTPTRSSTSSPASAGSAPSPTR